MVWVPPLMVCPWSDCSLGPEFAAMGTGFAQGGYVSSDVAFFFPFSLDGPATIRRLGWANGPSVSGYVDAGIYSHALDRLISTGSTAQSGTDQEQTVDVADTALAPGRYYLAIVQSDGGAPVRAILSYATVLKTLGCFQQASAFPLPATASPAAIGSGNPPYPYAMFGRFV